MLLLAGGLGMAVALAGCTSGPSGPAKPARPSPAIPGDPLDLSKAAARPCTMLRPDQLAQFRLTSPGTTTSIASGPACAWTPTVTGFPSYLAGVDLHSGGLEALYHKRASLPVFQPTKISEYLDYTDPCPPPTTWPPRSSPTPKVPRPNPVRTSRPR